MAMVATGPTPGSTPISVPRKHPMKAYIRFCIVKATLNPRDRLLMRSMIQFPLQPVMKVGQTWN